MRRAVLAIAIAGCQTQGGVEIEVASGPDVDRVALYIGVGNSSTGVLGPEGFEFGIKDAKWWTRDVGNESDVQKPIDGATRFQFQRGTHDWLDAIAAVGFRGDTIVSAAWHDAVPIPDDIIARYELDLVVQDSRTGATEWSALPGAPTPGTCVHVEDKVSGQSRMIVTAGDRDCDGYADSDSKECVPNIWAATRGPDLAHVKCAADETVLDAQMMPTPVCVLGGPACVDGKGYVDGCIGSPYCVARSVCETCGNDYACITDIVTHAPQGNPAMRLVCPVAIDPQGNMCPDLIPAFNMMNRPALGARMCTGKPRIGNGGPFAEDLTVGTATFKLTNLTAACTFEIKPVGKFTGGGAAISAFAVADLDNGRGVGVPIVFRVDNLAAGCGNPKPCFIENAFAPDLVSCVNAPVIVP